VTLEELVDEIAQVNPLREPERFDALFQAFLDAWMEKHGD
jgi:hypothetical protein